MPSPCIFTPRCIQHREAAPARVWPGSCHEVLLDNSKVIVCVRADRGDLEREADRLNYRLQLKNHPFGTLDEQAAAGEIDTATYYAEHESATLDECRGLLNRQCDSADQPMLDPGLFKRALHPEMLPK